MESITLIENLARCVWLQKGIHGNLVGRVYHPTESQPRSNFKRVWTDALAELGRFAEAKAQFERALEINPAHALAQENLQQLQSAMGNQ
jgi:tetratricopeptide (TPR) repeat protein